MILSRCSKISAIVVSKIASNFCSVKRDSNQSMASEAQQNHHQQQPASTKAPSVAASLRLEDVYDIATKVSEQFQVLASQFGGSRLSTIIPIVLDALEHLENVTTANQELEIKVRKLILSNDALAREKDETTAELKGHDQLKEDLKHERRETKRLAEEVDRLRKKNESLNRKMDQMRQERDIPQLTSLCTVVEENEVCQNGGDLHSLSSLNGQSCPNGIDASSDDVMAMTRVNRRLTILESELDLTKAKFITSQASLQSLMSENAALKLQLEEYKAELSLKSIESTRMTVSCASCSPEREGSAAQSPRFYKDDLLRVLKERNELKEEIDHLRDELSLTQAELRKTQSSSRVFRRRSRSRTPPAWERSSTTRVREIFDSLRIEEYDIINKP